ncbi:MAG: hypothetical protein Q4B28_07210 [bacterium]|nr:hypothetical protein [bacterium]
MIPPYDLGGWNRPGGQIALFHYPYLRSTTDLGEVGKIYRKLYEDIFCLKDWKGLLEKKHPNRQEEKGDSVYYQYIVGE